MFSLLKYFGIEECELEKYAKINPYLAVRDSVEDKDVVILGEYHGSPIIENFRLKLIPRLCPPFKRVALEIDQSDQEILDFYMKTGKFKKFWHRFWCPFKRTIQLCRKHSIPVYAVDVRRGLELEPESERRIAKNILELGERTIVIFGNAHAAKCGVSLAYYLYQEIGDKLFTIRSEMLDDVRLIRNSTLKKLLDTQPLFITEEEFLKKI